MECNCKNNVLCISNRVPFLCFALMAAALGASKGVNAIFLATSTLIILISSSLIMSLIKGLISRRIVIFSYTMIVAGFTGILSMLTEAYFPSYFIELDIFLPMVLVYVLALSRGGLIPYNYSLSDSLKEMVLTSILFLLLLTAVGVLREVLGQGKFFGTRVMPKSFKPVMLVDMLPGVFILLSFIFAFYNYLNRAKEV